MHKVSKKITTNISALCFQVEDLGCNANTNSGLLIKDKVIIYPIIACRTCSSCLRGQEQACLGNTPFIGFDLGGGYAEYVKVPHYKYVCPAPVNLPIELAALLPCSGLTSYSALSKAAKYLEETLNVTEDASVLIIGAGGIGLWAISLSNVIFSPNVKLTVADCQEEKLKKCKEMGVQRTVIWDFDSSEESVIESTLQTCSGRVDVVIDFVGSTLTVNRAASLVKRGGKILLIGLFGGSNPVMLSHMILDSITFQGSKMGSLKDLQDLVKLIDENKIQFPPMTLTSFDDSINNIMTSMKQGKLIGRYIMKVKQD